MKYPPAKASGFPLVSNIRVSITLPLCQCSITKLAVAAGVEPAMALIRHITLFKSAGLANVPILPLLLTACCPFLSRTEFFRFKAGGTAGIPKGNKNWCSVMESNHPKLMLNALQAFPLPLRYNTAYVKQHY